MLTSGARVSNAWITYLSIGDNLGKLELIPNTFFETSVDKKKAFGRRKIGPRSISLLVR
jgi:hypothetical protein